VSKDNSPNASTRPDFVKKVHAVVEEKPVKRPKGKATPLAAAQGADSDNRRTGKNSPGR
jgi:hypothetical protein